MSWIAKQQKCTLGAVLRVTPLRGQHQAGATLNWNTLGQHVQTHSQGSPPVCELQLSHLPHFPAAALLHAQSIEVLASAHRHEPRLPHGGKLSSPCPAPRLAAATCYSSPSCSTHSLPWFFNSSFPCFQLLLTSAHPCARMSPSPQTQQSTCSLAAAPCFLHCRDLGEETSPQL